MDPALEARFGALEAQIAGAETNEEFDALEPALRKLRGDVWAALDREAAARPSGEPSHWWQRIFPAAPAEPDSSLERRTAQLVERFYQDKTRTHARALIRVAEKIQREVPGDWPVKAAAAYGGLAVGRSADDAVAYAEAVVRAVDDPDAIAAAILSGRPPDEAARRLRTLANDELPPVALLSPHADPPAFARALDAPPGVARSAALLAPLDAPHARAIIGALEDPRVAAAALLGGLSVDDARARAGRALDLPGAITAALVMSGRDPDEARALLSATRGSGSAEETLVAAGLLARRGLEESVAIIRHVQGELTGSWETEAQVIAGAILSGSASDPTARASFLIPGLFR